MILIPAILPEEYKSKVKSLENDLENEDDPLALDRMFVELGAKYEKICKKNNYNPENKDLTKGRKRNNNNGMVVAASGNGVFKGRRYICENSGHKSHQCPYRNNGNTLNGQTTQNMSSTNNTTNTNHNANSNPNPTGNNTNKYVPPRRPRFQGKCGHCEIWVLRIEECWFLKNNQFRHAEKVNVCKPAPPDVPQNGVEEKVVPINKMPTVRNEESGLNEPRTDVWIADSGASSHMTNDTRGLINTWNIKSKVKIGGGDYIEAELIRDLRGIAKQKNGKETPITLTNVITYHSFCAT